MQTAERPRQQAEASCTLQVAETEHIYDHIIANAAGVDPVMGVVRKVTSPNQTVVICGAGPSLADHARSLPRADAVWGCNSALNYLADNGIRVTHGIGIDPGLEMMDDREWKRTFDVTYFLASSVHPELVRHLRENGRYYKFFHNYLGAPDPPGYKRKFLAGPDPQSQRPGAKGKKVGRESYEQMVYRTHWPEMPLAGYGLNCTPRAVCLALLMGYRHIFVYGADCACKPDGEPMSEHTDERYEEWLAGVQFYADGTPASYYGARRAMLEAVIDGRRWHTRPDMAISAVHLVQLQQRFPDRVRLMGDTLPNAIKDKPQAFFDEMPRLDGYGKVAGIGVYVPKDNQVAE